MLAPPIARPVTLPGLDAARFEPAPKLERALGARFGFIFSNRLEVVLTGASSLPHLRAQPVNDRGARRTRRGPSRTA
jgi:hypothetical protein